MIEYPGALGREDRLPELATSPMRNQMGVTLIIGPAPLEAARKATKRIPMVIGRKEQRHALASKEGVVQGRSIVAEICAFV